jgi:hypothetical protein
MIHGSQAIEHDTFEWPVAYAMQELKDMVHLKAICSVPRFSETDKMVT